MEVGGGHLLALCEFFEDFFKHVEQGKRHALGFTLAEVLVTLGIIGVVSAMTVPTLMQNHQRKTYVTQLHKVYNEIQQAAVNYITERNALNLIEAGINSQAKANEFITSNFIVVQTCENSITPCFAASYKSINGTAVSGYEVARTAYVLANGASVRPGYYYSGKGGSSYQSVINLLIDTNGQKGPNIQGRDFFNVGIYADGTIDEIEVNNALQLPLSKEQREQLFNRNCLSGNVGYGCLGKLLNDNWEMNY